MNMNLSKYLRAVSSLFFIFTLLFSGMAQASVFQKIRTFKMMIQSLGIPQSQIDRVVSILKDLNIQPYSLSRNEMRALVRALDEPTYLINLDGPFGSDFTGRLFSKRINRKFFFHLFDLHRDSDTLFTKLFASKGGNELGELLEELPFEEAKSNWEIFYDAVRKARKFDYNIQFTDTDLEAAAISFIHRRLDRYSYKIRDSHLPYAEDYLKSWGGGDQSLGMFFQQEFTMAHYISPHFTLTQEDSYYRFIMSMIILSDSVDYSALGYHNGLIVRSTDLYGTHIILNRNFSESMNSKEFVLKLWSNITEEISRRGSSGIYGTAFSGHIVRSISRVLKSETSLESDPFLRVVMEVAREDDRLAKVLKNIVEDWISFQSRTGIRIPRVSLEEAINDSF